MIYRRAKQMPSIETINYLRVYEEAIKTQVLFVEVELKHGVHKGILEKVDSENGLYWVNGCKFWQEVNTFTTKHIIEKDGVNMENIKNVLANGVKVFEIEAGEDFDLAQEILDMNPNTETICAESAYNERVTDEFEGSYLVKVSRAADYQRFMKMFNDEQCYNAFFKENYKKWLKDEMTNKEWNEGVTRTQECECKKCKAIETRISMEEWQTGKHSSGAKLGKTLRKMGFSQELIDFYSAQVKTEREIFFTVTGLPQFIAGMSNFAKMGSWDGYMNTSCQDTRHGGTMAVNLAGALHDDKFFVGMLHESLDDLEDMQDKLLARVMFRMVEIDGVNHLIPTRYYGNNETKSEMDIALKQLAEARIHDMDIRDWVEEDDSVSMHREEANGLYEMCLMEDVEICETIDEDVTCDCPMCEGSGEYYVWLQDDTQHSINCPMCGGDGEWTVSVYEEIEEYVEVERDVEISPYFMSEGWEHEGNYILIMVNYSEIRRQHKMYGVVTSDC